MQRALLCVAILAAAAAYALPVNDQDRPWTESDDALLRALVAPGNRTWAEIGAMMRPPRSAGDCQAHWRDHLDPNIFDFKEHAGTQGIQFLRTNPGSSEESASAQDSRKILQSLGVHYYHNFNSYPSVQLIDPAGRRALIEYADKEALVQAHRDARDAKLDLTQQELAQLITQDTVASLRRFFGGDISHIKLRRTTSTGNHSIMFHLDEADVNTRTMQIPLNDPSEYEGGRLVFATNDGLAWPSRAAGSATIHDHTIPHGVSAISRGVRYSLFFLQADPTATFALAPK